MEGERATGTASQTSTQSAFERRAVFGKAWRPNVHERRGVGSGQRKTNTRTDADVLTAADARRGNKTGRAEEKLVDKPERVRSVARLLERSGASREVTGSSRVILVRENKLSISFAWFERVTSCSQHHENRAAFPVSAGLMTPLMTQDGRQSLYYSWQ